MISHLTQTSPTLTHRYEHITVATVLREVADVSVCPCIVSGFEVIGPAFMRSVLISFTLCSIDRYQATWFLRVVSNFICDCSNLMETRVIPADIFGNIGRFLDDWSYLLII